MSSSDIVWACKHKINKLDLETENIYKLLQYHYNIIRLACKIKYLIYTEKNLICLLYNFVTSIICYCWLTCITSLPEWENLRLSFRTQWSWGSQEKGQGRRALKPVTYYNSILIVNILQQSKLSLLATINEWHRPTISILCPHVVKMRIRRLEDPDPQHVVLSASCQ